MRALSIRQPWAWLILHGGKDIENRNWPTKVRGRVLIHASATMTHDDYRFCAEYVRLNLPWAKIIIPPMLMLKRGGIVGSVEITSCVASSESPWFVGEFGFVLAKPEVLPFAARKGRLGFFEVEL